MIWYKKFQNYLGNNSNGFKFIHECSCCLKPPGLYRPVKREEKLYQEILAFSISHDRTSVRLYSEYPVIKGDKRSVRVGSAYPTAGVEAFSDSWYSGWFYRRGHLASM